MTPVRIELLGNLRVAFGEKLLTSVNTSRLQSLLAYLVLHAGAPRSREQLASLLWPDSNGPQARTNLRQLLHQLRRALPPECSLLAIDHHTVCWTLDSNCSVDVREFESAAAQAADAEKKGAFAAARQALKEALRVYHDDLLPGLYDEWLQPKREELRRQLGDVLHRLAVLDEAAGDYPAAILSATRLIVIDPLREPSYQLLMRLHARNNDRASAMRVYHQCARVLRRELGVSPSPATRELCDQAVKSEQAPAAIHDSVAHPKAVLPAIVGRTAEWEQLLECWRRVSGGATHCALILGEPGIGKSRLAEELFRYCARGTGWAVARSRCYFAQGRLAYGPVAEWLRADSLRTARAPLTRPQLAELGRLLPEIRMENPQIPAPPPLTESWQRRHFYEALNTGFAKASRPLLLLIDDLQWCDSDSFEWLHFFLQSEAAAATLVVGTVRPEETDRDHPLSNLTRDLRQSGHLTELPLQPLTLDETATLAYQAAGRECDSGFIARLYQTTKGNPLFVIESVRSSFEGQAVSPAGLPPRVQAVISARMAQLSQSAFAVAEIAAAAGRPASTDLLAKATDWDEDCLSRALEELWRRRILAEPEPGTYDFTHDLLREVAYAEMSPVRRRSLHKRVAAALKELYRDDLNSISGWLAAHYESAGMAEDAIRFYRSAAGVAKHRFAETEAADLLRNALRLCRSFPESAKRDQLEVELLATLGPCLVVTQGFSAAEVGDTYERGLQLAKLPDGRKHLFSMLSGAWTFHLVRGQFGESKGLAEYWVEEASRDRAIPIEMAGRFLLGASLFHQGQLVPARKQLEQAMPALSCAAHPALALFAAGPTLDIFCRGYLSHAVWLTGDAELAEAIGEEAIGMSRDSSHPFSLAFGLYYRAVLAVFRGDIPCALARASEAAQVCGKYGFAYYLACAEILAGWASAMDGDPAGGLSRLHGGLEALKALGAETRLPLYYGLLAEVSGLSGRTDEALANIENAFASQNKNGELWFGPELHRIQGDVLLRAGDARSAHISYGRAVETARQVGSKAFERRAASRLAEIPNAGNTRNKITERA